MLMTELTSAIATLTGVRVLRVYVYIPGPPKYYKAGVYTVLNLISILEKHIFSGKGRQSLNVMRICKMLDHALYLISYGN